jgi:class 3 adenylate cyclase
MRKFSRRLTDAVSGAGELVAETAVSRVIGTKKFIYDLWGDTVNMASRMESQGRPGMIQVTEAVFLSLRDRVLRSAAAGGGQGPRRHDYLRIARMQAGRETGIRWRAVEEACAEPTRAWQESFLVVQY